MSLPVALRRRLLRPAARVLAGAGLVTALGVVAAACGDDGRSTVGAHRLIIETCQERVDQRATASAIGPDLVVSVAHGLAEARTVVLRSPDGRSRSAEVVYLDEGTDIALLRTEHDLPDHLALTAPDGPGPIGVLRLDRDDRPAIDRGEILELTSVTLDGEGRRAAARLQADIDPGDSGAAVLDRDGAMVAMVFATARDRDIAWAVSAIEIERAVEAMGDGGAATGSPAC